MNHFFVLLLTRLQLLNFLSQLEGDCGDCGEGERAPHSFADLHLVHTFKNQIHSSLTLKTICILARKEMKFSAQWRT